MTISVRTYALLIVFIAFNPCSAQDAASVRTSSHYGIAYRNTFGKFPLKSTIGDTMFANFFYRETQAISNRSIDSNQSREAWEHQRIELRKQLFEMLSLDPLPSKSDLQATVTGTIEDADFSVQKLHFQSRPGLYATANVYVPKNISKPVPAILYVCGHGKVNIDGVSYGNKVTYQHHGAWFAKNGYVCLILDSVQLGEIEGIHHGTHHDGMWWWNSRGYSPAGAEAWNCIRAIDYLQSRPDVDDQRIGVTGRSGGGAYSWWIAALDERVKVACPVAGITDLQNHVIDGCVEGHCDCMYMVNTYRWDYDRVAALLAPRPLLICNTDKDRIFPLDGLVRLHSRVRKIYDLYDVPNKLGLLITEGPHLDTQELQVPVMRWFNKWLKNDESPVANYAEKLFTPQQLKVFDRLPDDEITSRCYEHFTELAKDSNSLDSSITLASLRSKTFAAWPIEEELNKLSSLEIREISKADSDGVRLSIHEFESQPGMRLRFYLAQPSNAEAESLRIEIVDQANWLKQLQMRQIGFAHVLKEELEASGVDSSKSVDPTSDEQFKKWISDIREHKAAHITFTPRGVGLSVLGEDEKYRTNVQRRFMLLGATMASSQVWDLIRATEAVKKLSKFDNLPIHIVASPEMTEIASFAVLFGSPIESLSLAFAPRNDKVAPDFLNWSRLVTPNQLLELAKAKTKVTINKR